MTDYEYIRDALAIARQAHAGQTDKSGVDYIYHPLTVALLCNSTEEKIVALLHDVIEDTSVTMEDLKEYKFPKVVYDSLELLTHIPDKSNQHDYEDYVKRIKSSGNRTAINVKIADLTHNMDSSRLGGKKHKKYDTYVWAINYLRDTR